MGAVAESTVATPTPACFTPITNSTELTAVRAASSASDFPAAGDAVRTAPSAPRAQGVATSTRPTTGSRIAWAVVESTSLKAGLSMMAETAHATEARVAAPSPSQSRFGSSGSIWRLPTMMARPPRVSMEPSRRAGVRGSPSSGAASRAARSG
jgi:hypothetical protein